MSGDISGYQTLGRLLLAPNGKRAQMPCGTVACLQQDYLSKNANNAKAEEPCSRFWWQGCLSEFLGVIHNFKKYILTCFIFIHKNKVTLKFCTS